MGGKPDIPARVSGENYALGFISACLFIYLCKVGAGVMIPLTIAVFIWYLINALSRLQAVVGARMGVRIPSLWRKTAGAAFLVAVIAVVSLLIRNNVQQVMVAAPQFQQSFMHIAVRAADFLGMDHTPTGREIFDEFQARVDIGAAIRAFVGMLTYIAGKTLVVLFFVGFLLYEQRFFDGKLSRLMRDPAREARLRAILRRIDNKIQRYIGVKAFVSFLDSLLTYMILSTFKVEFAVFWGVMAFFLHFIPYAGSFVAITLPVLISLIQFGSLDLSLLVLLSLCISHAFLGHVLDPYLMGSNLNLSPIFIISNLAMWGMIWGVPGMFLAIPILAMVMIALSQFEQTRPLAVLFSKTGKLDKEVGDE